jgi:hypothetical protein
LHVFAALDANGRGCACLHSSENGLWQGEASNLLVEGGDSLANRLYGKSASTGRGISLAMKVMGALVLRSSLDYFLTVLLFSVTRFAN